MSPQKTKSEAPFSGSLLKLKETLNETKIEDKLPIEVFDDEFLLPFLKARKFDVKRAASLVKNFISIREKLSNVTLPSNILELFKESDISIGLLKNRDKLGRLIFYAKSSNWQPDEVPFEQMLYFCYLLVVEASKDKCVQEKGLVAILDLEGASLMHIQKIGFSGVKMANKLFLDSVPVRIKEIHVVNNNYFGNILFSLSKLCLKAKIINRHILHGTSYDKLLTHFDASILPHYYGGHLPIEEAIDQNVINI